MPTFLETTNGLATVPNQSVLVTLDAALFTTVQTLGATAIDDGGAALWAGLQPPQTPNGTTILAGANGSYFGKIVQSSGGGGMTNPMTTLGDIITGGTAGAPQRLGIGTAGQVLTVTSGAPAWAAPSGGGGGIPMADRDINVDFDYAGNIQAAINAALAISTSNPPAIYLGPHNYNVSATLNIGSSTSSNITGVKIYGSSRLGTQITMTTANTPIFTITGALIHSFQFKDFTVGYSTLQTAAQTNASCFNINGGSGGSFYNSIFSNLRAQNFNMFLTCTSVSAWGLAYKDCWFGDLSLGINNITAGAGEPRCLFQNLYILAPSATGVLFTHNAMTAHYDNIECNGLNSGATLLLDDGGGTHIITHWALEVATYNASGNTILFEAHNSVILADHIYLNTLTIGSGATVYMFHCEQTSGNISYYTCKYAFGVNWTNNGAFYVSDSPGGQKCHLGQVSFPWASNCALSVATFQAANVVVDDWNDESNINFLADANATLTYNSPRTNIMHASMTAARTITIPDGTAVPNNIFGGRRFTFVKDNTAAFLLTIKSTNGTTITTIPASVRGKLELMFDSGTLNAWVVLENTTFS